MDFNLGDILTNLDIFFSGSPLDIFLNLFRNGGWFFILIAFLVALYKSWIFLRQCRYDESVKRIVLSLTLPRVNTNKTLKSVENIFAQLAGAHTTFNLWETYVLGIFQLSFSFEIVSMNGRLHLFVRTPVRFKPLIESIFYAQYPDIEITEVNDYVNSVPNTYPDPNYDIWGTEFILVKDQSYPLRSYIEFEEQLSQELKDPMAGMLECLGKLGPDEQGWFQIIVKPIADTDWKEGSKKMIDKILKQEIKHSGLGASISNAASNAAYSGVEMFNQTLWGTEPAAAAKVQAGADQSRLNLMLNPTIRQELDAIQRKASKIGFHVKIRYIYIGKHQSFDKARGVYGVIGAIKQLNSVNLNSLKPDMKKTATRAYYFFVKLRVKWKKEKIMRGYKARSTVRGRNMFVLNTEELATLFHLPVDQVKSPYLQRTGAKKAEPPLTLPLAN